MKSFLRGQISTAGASCLYCGCTEDRACAVRGGFGCSWVRIPQTEGLNVCSACWESGKAVQPHMEVYFPGDPVLQCMHAREWCLSRGLCFGEAQGLIRGSTWPHAARVEVYFPRVPLELRKAAAPTNEEEAA